MKIIKCSCDRSIHVFSIYGGKCPFCNNSINDLEDINNLFIGRLSFLKEKVTQIDENYIYMKNSGEALSLIDEVLEVMPGFEIGEIPGSGEIYWRKLLAETKCRSDVELLRCKDKLLQSYPSFNNAVKYANDTEKPVYALVKSTEDLIAELLLKSLAEREPVVKSETGVENTLLEIKQQLSALKNLAQKNITRLEEIEKLIHEQVIDCAIVSGEHKYALENLLSDAQKVSNNYKSEISKDEKADWEAKLNNILSKSNDELNSLKQLSNNHRTTHPKFLEYYRLVNESKSIQGEISQNIDDMFRLNSEANELKSSIERIIKDFDKARTDIHKGTYRSAESLLPQGNFDEIVNKAMSEIKADGSL